MRFLQFVPRDRRYTVARCMVLGTVRDDEAFKARAHWGCGVTVLNERALAERYLLRVRERHATKIGGDTFSFTLPGRAPRVSSPARSRGGPMAMRACVPASRRPADGTGRAARELDTKSRTRVAGCCCGSLSTPAARAEGMTAFFCSSTAKNAGRKCAVCAQPGAGIRWYSGGAATSRGGPSVDSSGAGFTWRQSFDKCLATSVDTVERD